MKDKRKKNKFKCAFDGIKYGFINTKNLRIYLIFILVIIISGIVLEISLIEWLITMLCITLVISLELVNTAIEEEVNIVSPEINPIAKASKDVAAGAVLFAAIMSTAIGFTIFLPKFILWIKEVL